MKICHVITGLNDGGAEAVLYRLCTSDTENRHVVISLMDEGKYGPLLRASGVKVYTLGMPRGKVTIEALVRLWRLLRSVRPDVVQTWMYHADLVGGVGHEGKDPVGGNIENYTHHPGHEAVAGVKEFHQPLAALCLGQEGGRYTGKEGKYYDLDNVTLGKGFGNVIGNPVDHTFQYIHIYFHGFFNRQVDPDAGADN